VEVIRAEGLRRSYGDVVAVAGVDLTVHEGEIVCILGPNGAGKTTTIEMLLGLRTPTSGEVRVFGAGPRSPAVRARVGAMLQDTDAPESLTVAEMVDLVAAYYPYRLPRAEVLQRAHLNDHADSRVTQLSGGLRQRLSFALCIAGDPDLLFLDEPTAALDVQARRGFWEQVEEFASLGKTILFSTHNLAEADTLAQRVVVIDAGVVVHDGTPHQIKQLVAGRVLTLRTDAAEQALWSMPGVRQVSRLPDDAGADLAHDGSPDGQEALPRWRVQAIDAAPVLRAMFDVGHEVRELTVAEASLEDAFLHLTGGEDRQ
jgi:ABC-2 type transport system ATP-binding protein